MVNVANHPEMQIKTTTKYHLTPVRMAVIQKTASLSFHPFWGGALHSGELPRVTSSALVFLFRLHLDIISKRSCLQDDHAGRSRAQDDAAGPRAELPAQRVPAGR